MTFMPAVTKQTVPQVSERAVASGADFQMGALLVIDAAGAYAEAGVNPATVAAIALSGYGPRSGGAEFPLGREEFPPFRMQAADVSLEEEYTAETMGVVPSPVIGQFGVTRDTDNRWKVDFGKTTTNARVNVLGAVDGNIPYPGAATGTARLRVRLKFIAANIEEI